MSLTFDDRLDPKYTLMLLDVLRANYIECAFFVLSENAQNNLA
ncbi:polysaccharide deacetylase family protein [Clostridium drakei]